MLSCEVQEDADDEGMVGHYTVYMHLIIFILFCNCLTLLYLDNRLGDFVPSPVACTWIARQTL